MNSKFNPFIMKGYHSPDLFCDRDSETNAIMSNANNNVNTTLISLRRMGKTGLIHHVFHQLNKKSDWVCIYVDIYSTLTISDFTSQFASAVFRSLPQNQSIGKRFLKLIRNFNPVIKFDSLTGNPELSIIYNENQQTEFSLKSIFEFLDSQNKKILVAFDEFQQVSQYPEKNTDAILRTIIQTLKNVVFIFSGSNKHMLIEMFNSAKRPFFSSTSPVLLEEITKKKYSDFIRNAFEKEGRHIDNESIDFILEWTRIHTYYTQALCNKAFLMNGKRIQKEQVLLCCESILKENEAIYYQYRNLLTLPQWNLLTAIAREDKVYQPTGNEFITKHMLGNSASVRRSLLSLENKEMIVKIVKKDSSYYQVYDCFVSRWLGRH